MRKPLIIALLTILGIILAGVLIWLSSSNTSRYHLTADLPTEFSTKYIAKEKFTLGSAIPLKFNTNVSDHKESDTVSKPKYSAINSKNWLTCKPHSTAKTDAARLSYFNARSAWHGCVSRIYTQGLCGACWAFSSTTALSTRFCLATCNYKGKLPVEYAISCITPTTINLMAQEVLRKIRGEKAIRENKCICDVADEINPGKNLLRFNTWKAYFGPAAKALVNGKASKNQTKRINDLFDALDPQAVAKPVAGDAPEAAERAVKGAFLYFDLNADGFIDTHEWNIGHLHGPISLSVQVPITCLLSDNTSVLSRYNTECGGSTLQRAWQYLCSWGTPDERCALYTLGGQHTSKQSENIASTFCPQVPSTKEINAGGGAKYDDQRKDPNWLSDGRVGAAAKLSWEKLRSKYLRNKRHGVKENFSHCEHSPIFKARSAYTVGHGDWSCQRQFSIMREIATRGPVSAGIHVYPSFIHDFGGSGLGGQGYWRKGDKWPPVNPAWGNSSTALIYSTEQKEESIGGHAVVIIGWGEFKTKDTSVPYWIVANSWGVSWGTSGGNKGLNGLPKSFTWDKDLGNGGGHFWILRGANTCGIEDLIVAGLPDIDSIVATGSVPDAAFFAINQGDALLSSGQALTDELVGGKVALDSGIPRGILPCGPYCIAGTYDGPCIAKGKHKGKCAVTGVKCKAGEDKWSTCANISYGACAKDGYCEKRVKGFNKIECIIDQDCTGGDSACCMSGSGRKGIPCIKAPPRNVIFKKRGVKLAQTCKCIGQKSKVRNHQYRKLPYRSLYASKQVPSWSISQGIMGTPQKCQKICSEHPKCVAFSIGKPHYWDPNDYTWRAGSPPKGLKVDESGNTPEEDKKAQGIQFVKKKIDAHSDDRDRKKGDSISIKQATEFNVSSPRCWFYEDHDEDANIDRLFDTYIADRGELVNCDTHNSPCGDGGQCGCDLGWVAKDKTQAPGSIFFSGLEEGI